MPFLRQIEQRIQRIAPEGQRFGSALHFDELAAAGHDDVHVDFGARVFLVRQVEHARVVDDADAGGGDVVLHRNLG